MRPYYNGFDYIAYDIETTGLEKDATIIGISMCAEEKQAHYYIIYKWEDDQLIEIPGMKDYVLDLLNVLKTKHIIAHNSVFDCSMTNNYFKIDLMPSVHTDTMILAHLLNENRRVGLKELASTMFGENAAEEQRLMKESVLANGGQLTKDNYELYKADSQLLGKYGAQDALLTYKLFTHLVPELYDQGLDKFFYEDESMPLLKGPTYQLNTVGLKIDTKKLSELKRTLQAECLEAKDFISKEIAGFIKDKYPGTNKKNVFNIGSSSQLSWLLFGELKLEFSTLTKAGKDVCKKLVGKLPYTYSAKRDFIELCQQAKDNGVYLSPPSKINGKVNKGKKYREPWNYIACDKKTLQKLAPKHKWIERLLEYQRKTKLLNTYVEGIEERTKYGIIHPAYLQHGTSSGRYASRNPNFQNLPRDEKRIKEIVIARPGKVFVGADYSQLEPRIFSYYSGDEKLMKAFDGTTDFYSVVGIDTYDIIDALPIKEGSPDAFGIKYKKLRNDAKLIALAVAYGATAGQLAPALSKSIDETQDIINRYLEAFPGVSKMTVEAHELAKTQGFVTNLFGRKRRLPEALDIPKIYGKMKHKDLPYQARSLLNLACNHRIQSTAASIVNRSAIKFCNDVKNNKIDAKIVLQVHDELVVECNEDDAELVSLLLQDAMENTIILPGVPLEAIPRVTRNLSK
jgi:DNA polymerase I-like protein with 3'-5' exonuclease and polymerase domains